MEKLQLLANMLSAELLVGVTCASSASFIFLLFSCPLQRYQLESH